MEGEKLYKYRELCTDLKLTCCKNANRAIDFMKTNHKHSNLLGKYLELHIIMEKLCDYTMKCCCLTEVISKYTIYDIAEKCKEIIKLSGKLDKVLNKKESEYLRCQEIIDLAKILLSKSIVNKKKTKKTNL